jgi:hypothetical protein
MHRRVTSVSACLLALTLTIVGGCRGNAPRAPRVILIGMDGATLEIVDPLIAAGHLPTLASLAREGVSGPLRSLRPLLSPRIWATVATGKKTDKHGIEGFFKATGGGKGAFYYSSDRKVHALWNIASNAGMTVSVVSWLNTYPPEVVNGVMVSEHTFEDDIPTKEPFVFGVARSQGLTLDVPLEGADRSSPVYPESWLERVRAAGVAPPGSSIQKNGVSPHPPLPSNIDRSVIAAYLDRDERMTRVALDIDRELSPRLTMVLLRGIDRVSHAAYGCTAAPETYPRGFQPTAVERKNCIDLLESFYKSVDALIGQLIQDFGPDDLVIVASDHGFEPSFNMRLTGDHWTDAAIDGIFFARGKGIPRGKPAGEIAITYITPMILTWLGLPLAEDMDGIEPAFLKVERAGLIKTYDTRPIERLQSTHSGQEERLREGLKSLGYVD